MNHRHMSPHHFDPLQLLPFDTPSDISAVGARVYIYQYVYTDEGRRL